MTTTTSDLYACLRPFPHFHQCTGACSTIHWLPAARDLNPGTHLDIPTVLSLGHIKLDANPQIRGEMCFPEEADDTEPFGVWKEYSSPQD
jgi:hypothetical protein